MGFKAPKRIDPRLLDPRSVFEDLSDKAPNNEAKVYQPEIKKRKRDGYEEGEYIQFKEITASEFIQTMDPIAILGQYNKLSFAQPKNGDVALAALDKLPETTLEIRNCCGDLKLLGRKEFKLLLRWRLKVREIFGFPSKKTQAAEAAEAEEVAEVEPMDEEMRIQKDLQDLKDKENSKKKRAKRRENEKKTKEINRLNMNMIMDMDIGKEQEGPRGEGSLFGLKTAGLDVASSAARVGKGKMTKISDEPKPDRDSGLGSSGETDDESDEEEDGLEGELDSMYNQFQERKAESDAKYRAKKARKEHNDDEWEGVSGGEQEDSDDEGLEEESGDESDDSDEGPLPKSLLRDLDSTPAEVDGLSKRARNFFSQDIFQDLDIEADEPEEEDAEEEDEEMYEEEEEEEEEELEEVDGQVEEAEDDDDASSDDGIPSLAEQKKLRRAAVAAETAAGKKKGFEIIKEPKIANDEDWEEVDKRRQSGKPSKSPTANLAQARWQYVTNTMPDIEIITAEAMTLAHQLATGQRTKEDIIDEGFNKRAFKDRDGLPDWFIDDESKHDRPQKPITKAAADAIKEKLRAFNARPIKKVREAKARKKFKLAQRVEKLKKKSDMLANDGNMTEKDKAQSITKLMAKAARTTKQHNPIKVVKGAGMNRGLQGRPKGVKGRYKMVSSPSYSSFSSLLPILLPSRTNRIPGRSQNEEGDACDEEDSQEEEVDSIDKRERKKTQRVCGSKQYRSGTHHNSSDGLHYDWHLLPYSVSSLTQLLEWPFASISDARRIYIL